jgi:hypothetical protein
MVVGRSYKDGTRAKHLALTGQDDGQAGELLEPVDQRAGELGADMLGHDDSGREIHRPA